MDLGLTKLKIEHPPASSGIKTKAHKATAQLGLFRSIDNYGDDHENGHLFFMPLFIIIIPIALLVFKRKYVIFNIGKNKK